MVGANGAGKSTALKMITGVSHPTQGTVTVNGRVSALLELNAGFDGQLTGRENLKLRSQVMGMSKEEYAEIEEAVIDFAELGIYIDQPMKMYSSGMKARLGFAFAASIDPDILVVDEALSVGDKQFKAKCVDRMREIMSSEDVTVLFVTHESAAAEEFCTRGIVLTTARRCTTAPSTMPSNSTIKAASNETRLSRQKEDTMDYAAILRVVRVCAWATPTSRSSSICWATSPFWRIR